MSATEFNAEQRLEMLQLARRGIRAVVVEGVAPDWSSLKALPFWLKQQRACFVTLESHGQLRGCIGSLEAHRPLAEDIVHNAISAATQDYRFAPLEADEPIRITISVLSPLTPLVASDEHALLRQLKPEQDGVVFQAGRHRATFLPIVWQSLPDPAQFISELKRKAGLPGDYWSDSVRIWRYRTESFGEEGEAPVSATTDDT
jgi:AmmeMemoRadiSam system protein A